MKKVLMALTIMTSLNTAAIDFSIGLPSGFNYPDFSEIETAQENFVNTVEKLRASDQVKATVNSVEEKYNTTCVELQKESRGFKYYKLPYLCEGEKDFKLVVKVKLKKGYAVVKGYKIK